MLALEAMDQAISINGRPLKVAVVYSTSVVLSEGTSGGGVYENELFELLQEVSRRCSVEIVTFVPRTGRVGKTVRKSDYEHSVEWYRPTLAEKIFATAYFPGFSSVGKHLGLLKIRKQLRRIGVHFVYFASPNTVSLIIEDIPYVMTAWDVGHRDLPGFPEVWSQSIWARRENFFSTSIPRASFVMVDSNSTGQKLERYYGLESKNWHALGLMHGLEVRETPEREIESPYIIYPANRWPHKNHKTLLNAMPRVLRDYPSMKLVLTGNDGGNAGRVKEMVHHLSLEDSVIDLGDVSRERLQDLIFWAEALVMPSLLGPTNIPPLEALAMGTRAIVSDAHDKDFVVSEALSAVPALDSVAWAAAISRQLKTTPPKPRVRKSREGAFAVHEEVFRRMAAEVECWFPLK